MHQYSQNKQKLFNPSILCFIILTIVISSFWHGCVPVTPTTTPDKTVNKTLEFVDKTYEPFIKTVRLYPNLNLVSRDMEPPVVSLNNFPGLTLEFDALIEDYLTLQARIIHCDANWTKSRLSDIEVLNEYNAFDIIDFDYSQNTKTLYVNYRFQVPQPKVTGNFLLVVYQNNDQRDIVLSRRFMVFDNRVRLESDVALSSGVITRDLNHQINFTLNYSGLTVPNPRNNFLVVIRQNQRWDNAIIGLKPTFIHQSDNRMEYQHFDLQNNFQAGNEFRFIDLRQYSFRGQNVAYINKQVTPIQVHAVSDKSRARQVYAEFRDLNGNYFIQTREPGAGYLEADYMSVTFKLLSNEEMPEPVYLIGEFNGWNKSSNSKMTYNPAVKQYSIDVLLKQGFYNYMYETGSGSKAANPIEGSFYQTENQYEILVYYRPMGEFVDRLVGYASFRSEL